MNTIEVKIVKVEILNHPSASRLEIARIGGKGGYECVVSLRQFRSGDLVIYLPPDSVLPENIMESLAKNNISMKTNRLRAIKIRGILSEGLCLSPNEWLAADKIYEDNDVTEILGVTKYQPQPSSYSSGIFKSGKGISIHYKNDNFIKYNCVSHFKKYPNIIKVGEEVIITTKMHGTSHMAGWVDKPNFKKSWWEKIKNIIFKEKKKEFLVGSHNKIRFLNKNAIEYETYKTDLYWRAAIKYDIENISKQIAEANRLPDGSLPDIIIYAEIIGKNVQKGYCYSIPDGELEIRVFDIRINRRFISWDSVKHLCNCFNLPIVEEIYTGPWNLSLIKYAQAIDEYNGMKFNREGIVIRLATERHEHKCGRIIMKIINPDYLLDKKNTDFH